MPRKSTVGLYSLRIVAITTLFAVAGFSLAAEPQAREVSIEEEIGAFLEQYNEALSTRDPEAIRALYVTDHRFAWFEEGKLRYPSPDAILKSLAGFPASMTIATTFENLRVIPLGTQNERLSATASVSFVTHISSAEDAANSFTFNGIITLVLERSKGQWRIINGHTSSPSPGE